MTPTSASATSATSATSAVAATTKARPNASKRQPSLQQSVTKKNKFSKSLGSLLRFMEGIEIIVELKNGKRHRGILTNCDEFMNLTLDTGELSSSIATTTKSDDKQDYSSSFTTSLPATDTSAASMLDPSSFILDTNILSCMDIRGATIRYIQFPDNADLTNLVRNGVERERTAAKKYSRGKRKS